MAEEEKESYPVVEEYNQIFPLKSKEVMVKDRFS